MRLMYDAIYPANIPADATMVASYIDGKWPNYPDAVRRFPHAKHVSIAVFAQNDAMALDVEQYDATPGQAPGWVARQRGNGNPYPIVYMSATAWPVVRAQFTAQRVPEPVWWIADYSTLPLHDIPAGAHLRQFQGTTPPGYDVSVVADYVPGIDPAPIRKEQEMIIVSVDTATVPKGVAWPGSFVFDGATLTHIEPDVGSTSNLTNLSKAIGAPVTITYSQYMALNKIGQ